MIILDTNVISEAAKAERHRQVQDRLDRQQIHTLYTTAISLAEIMFGLERMPEGRRKSDLGRDMQFVLDRYLKTRILPFDEKCAHAYGKIIASAQLNGRSILIADGQIAAIAQVHGFTVATRDTAPFEAAGIPVVNPWTS